LLFNFRSLHSNFSRFRQRTMCWHDFTSQIPAILRFISAKLKTQVL
jgi:hypothetical protein